MRLPVFSLTLVLILRVHAAPIEGQSARPGVNSGGLPTSEQSREERHRDPQWVAVAGHLPNPETASARELELAADVLRARRLPEDALDYFAYALRRGGDGSRLLNKMGVTELEMNQVVAAMVYFQRVVKLDPKNAEGWNNLGAVEHMEQRYNSALSDYRRAVKLRGDTAVYHSNLGTAYFQEKDYSSARKEYERALALDPLVFDHSGSGGVAAHVMSPDDRGRFCFEMARMEAKRGNGEGMLHWLAMASEGGFDVVGAMIGDPELARYRKDPRVAVVVQNGRALRKGTAVASTGGGLPSLPAATPVAERP